MTAGMHVPAATAEMIRLLAPYADARLIGKRIGVNRSTVYHHIAELLAIGVTLGTPWIEPRMRRLKPGAYRRRETA